MIFDLNVLLRTEGNFYIELVAILSIAFAMVEAPKLQNVKKILHGANLSCVFKVGFEWDKSNARLLLTYAQERNYSNIRWEASLI